MKTNSKKRTQSLGDWIKKCRIRAAAATSPEEKIKALESAIAAMKINKKLNNDFRRAMLDR